MILYNQHIILNLNKSITQFRVKFKMPIKKDAQLLQQL